MGQIDIQQLRDWAAEYNRDKFIHSDPVQFPHRYSEAKDIEISAFLTAWISYGNRKCIITKAEELDRMFGGSPLHFILNNKYSNYQNNYYYTIKTGLLDFSNKPDITYSITLFNSGYLSTQVTHRSNDAFSFMPDFQ